VPAGARRRASDDRGSHLSPRIGRVASGLLLAVARVTIMSLCGLTDEDFRPGHPMVCCASKPLSSDNTPSRDSGWLLCTGCPFSVVHRGADGPRGSDDQMGRRDASRHLVGSRLS
jgi:hypothetical protein